MDIAMFLKKTYNHSKETMSRLYNHIRRSHWFALEWGRYDLRYWGINIHHTWIHWWWWWCWRRWWCANLYHLFMYLRIEVSAISLTKYLNVSSIPSIAPSIFACKLVNSAVKTTLFCINLVSSILSITLAFSQFPFNFTPPFFCSQFYVKTCFYCAKRSLLLDK